MTILEQNAYNAIISMAKKDEPDYWTRLEHHYAGMAMQGILSNEAMQKELMRVFGKEECIEDIIVDYAKDMALLLVRKMKEERK